ncbi:MAG: SPOR domain-containing protein [Gammaproteobacteria bacterium]|nr:SPOR domain-containing protein [Gammaproteobacteria bacterium]
MNFTLKYGLGFCLASSLFGCSSAPAVTEDNQSVAVNAEMEEWRKLKPGVQRLIAMESDLKQLIIQLDEFAKATDPDYQSDIAPQHKNTQVDVLDKNVFKETVVTPTPAEPEPVTPVLAQTVVSAEKSEAKVQQIVAATQAEPSVARVDHTPAVALTAQPTPEVKPEVEAVVEEVSPVTETVKVQQRYALQLASVVNPNQLVSTWTQIQRRHSSILSGMEPLYEKFQKGKTTFYRLKAMGTLTVADARSACSSIVGQGGQCFIGSNSGVKSVTEL